jgi:hypothetical protein
MTETSFEAELRRAMQAAAEPPDDGFTERVMARLPAQAPVREGAWGEWLQHAHWAAAGVAACVAGALVQSGDAPLDPARALAAFTLLGLLSFWSIPSRWSRP